MVTMIHGINRNNISQPKFYSGYSDKIWNPQLYNKNNKRSCCQKRQSSCSFCTQFCLPPDSNPEPIPTEYWLKILTYGIQKGRESICTFDCFQCIFSKISSKSLSIPPALIYTTCANRLFNYNITLYNSPHLPHHLQPLQLLRRLQYRHLLCIGTFVSPDG